MCRMCEMLGDGDIWYLNPKNYAHQMYRVPQGLVSTEAMREAAARPAGEMAREAAVARANGDMENFHRIINDVNARESRQAGSQVLPLKDAQAVMDLVQGPLGAMMCICRKLFRGTEEASLKEYSCLGLGTGMLKWERWPERYRGGVEFLSPSQAKEWLEYWDKRGYVHIIMQEGQNFIGGLCNCDYPTCEMIRLRLDYGLVNHMVKAEYVAKVDYDRCSGCTQCVARCQFGALRYEVALDKANVDPLKCFGCGLCETKCPREAIKLLPRKAFPALKDAW